MKKTIIIPRRRFQAALLCCLLAGLLPGCKKLVDVAPPVTSVTVESAYSEDKLASSVVNGIYGDMSTYSILSPETLSAYSSVYLGLMADELKVDNVINNTYLMWYRNQYDNGLGSNPWGGVYGKIIFRANAAIEGIGASTKLTPTVKTQLLGDCYFIRAFAYFYLVNLYGAVPLVITSDYKINAALPRSSTEDVYQQITNDLLMAKSLLSVDYRGVDAMTNTPTSRITPNRAAAQALLARVYLFRENYAAAASEASDVISQTTKYALTNLSSTFLAGSQEAIWQLQPTAAGYNTPDAQALVIPASGPDYSRPFTLNDRLAKAFEAGDLRKKNWVDSVKIGTVYYRYPAKYKVASFNSPVTEYKMVLRLAEQYLIRAEARAKIGTDLNGARADLDKLRTRAGLSGTTASTMPELLIAIAKERQVELFLEWGDRWFTLKRTKTIDQVMPAVAAEKGGSWSSYHQLLALPLIDLQISPNLVQNPGYN